MGHPEADLRRRWEALLKKAPRLRPWVDEMLGRHRLPELSRWLVHFEALPEFAVSAIAVTLEDEAAHLVHVGAPDEGALCSAASPEQAVSECEALFSDAAFALACHCVDARLRPELIESAKILQIPEADWFALLHAGARPHPLLSAEVAIALVLHVLSPGWALHPKECRHAALRLFLARPGDLRGDLQRICAALPPHWSMKPEQLPAFVSAAGRARVALADASRLCARIAASAKARPGGLALLTDEGAAPASPEELGALFRNVRKYGHMAGFRQLLSLL